MLFRTDAGVIMCSFHLLALHIIIKRTLFYKKILEIWNRQKKWKEKRKTTFINTAFHIG